MDNCDINPVIRLYTDDEPWDTSPCAESLVDYLFNMIFEQTLYGNNITQDTEDFIYAKKIFWLDERKPIEIKFNAKKGNLDVDSITKSIRMYIGARHKMQISIVLHRHDVRHPDLIMTQMQHIIEDVKDIANTKNEPIVSKRELIVIFEPLL